MVCAHFRMLIANVKHPGCLGQGPPTYYATVFAVGARRNHCYESSEHAGALYLPYVSCSSSDSCINVAVPNAQDVNTNLSNFIDTDK